jgi:hypothetical protein
MCHRLYNLITAPWQGWRIRVMEMSKWPKTAPKDLWFVRRYCDAKTYPASDLRCRYVKAKIMAKSSEVSTDRNDSKEVDGIFLCRYPDEKMPTHGARLTSELDLCPHTERREMIDALYRLDKG